MSTRYLLLAAALIAIPCGGAIAQAPAPPPGFNYDEARVGPAPILDPLHVSGSTIRTQAEWKRHRALLLQSFEDNVFGHTPDAARQLPLRYKVVEQDTSALGGLAVRRQVDISLTAGDDAPVMHLLLYLPAPSARRALVRVPVIVGLNFEGNASVSDAWGALGAWAWSLSRVVDYLLTDRRVDPAEIVVTGHSRLGKAADWAAAQDEQFAALLSTESGKGGQSLYRRNFGETIAHLDHSFPYWFCGNFAQWVGRDASMPVDGNLLLALTAPRPLYVASAQDDLFSDPRGEFLSASSVGPLYALFGKRGLGTTTMPTVNHPIQHDVAYHIRTGQHDVTAYDWEQYLNFLDQEFWSAANEESTREQTMSNCLRRIAGLLMIWACSCAIAQKDSAQVLNAESFHHYTQLFEQQEQRATGKPAVDGWSWMQKIFHGLRARTSSLKRCTTSVGMRGRSMSCKRGGAG